MEFLDRVLGINVVYYETISSMPNFINSRYKVQKVTLNGRAAAFVYPKTELDPAGAVKKHFDRISKSCGMAAVLVTDRLTYRRKEYLLREHIPFVVNEKQIYLPFMAVYLQERGDAEKTIDSDLLPSAQVLLLYYIYNGCGRLSTADAAKALGFTATSVSRASKQLEQLGIIQAEQQGVHKEIYSDKTPREMFMSAKGLLKDPVKRKIYVSKSEIKDDLLAGGYSALSEYAFINPPYVKEFASDSISKWEKSSTRSLLNENDQCRVALWRYDPGKLTNGKAVDRLSLALSLQNDKDAKAHICVDSHDMLDRRHIPGTLDKGDPYTERVRVGRDERL
ncbi:MarR family transcriptional regulator [Ruminococcus sp. NK3A76]|uniref:MarR family transcriptional regulator n=1 Tax=Ruminococcus sp. NK3A76 TaxID=877411 RepID=UPI00068FF849|nr:MarR family transcriptional regulator [Ruminococcus sp. NK3A76]